MLNRNSTIWAVLAVFSEIICLTQQGNLLEAACHIPEGERRPSAVGSSLYGLTG